MKLITYEREKDGSPKSFALICLDTVTSVLNKIDDIQRVYASTDGAITTFTITAKENIDIPKRVFLLWEKTVLMQEENVKLQRKELEKFRRGMKDAEEE